MGIFKLPSISTADRTPLVLQLREMVYDTDLNAIFIGDGITAGGIPIQNGTAAGATWGSIVGTLSSQTDLQNALDAKENSLGSGSNSQYLRGDKTWQNFPSTAPSGPAGGDLSGTFPNPNVVDDSHSHSYSTLTGVVPDSRSITPSSPLTGGGTLSSNLTISIPPADTATSGYLTSTDWNIFNNKYDSSSLTFKTIASQSIVGSGNISLIPDDVGLGSVTNDTQIPLSSLDDDTNLGGSNPSHSSVPTQFAVVSYIAAAIAGGIKFQGSWDADTNNPDLTGIGANIGDAYLVTVAGSTNLDGYDDWKVNDFAFYTSNGWVKIDNSTAFAEFASLGGDALDNSSLAGYLNAKVESTSTVITKPAIVVYDATDATGKTIKSSEVVINTTINSSNEEIPTSAAVLAAIASGTVADATSSSKGIIQLAGDLSGTADSPTVPGLALKEDTSNKENTALDSSTVKYPSNNTVKSYVDGQLVSVYDNFSNYQTLIAPGDLSVNSPLEFTTGNGTAALINGGASISIPQATTSVSGYLTNTDWNTFNNKESTSNKENATLTTSNTTYPTCNVVKTYTDTTFAAKTNNLSDLSSISTARTNLGVSATGADTTYAFRSNNLSDLASASTARTNLGLGTAAIRDVPSSGNAASNEVVLGSDTRLTTNSTITLSGDVTGSGTSAITATISSGAVSLAKMANLSAGTIIGNNTGSAATPLALTGSQVTQMLDLFSTTSNTKGLVPGSNNLSTSYFLRADGTWAQPTAAGGITTLNTLTAVTQTFATGASGTDFNISSSTSTHTFNIPSASASNRGLLTSADWSTFNGKLSANQSITFTPTGDVTGSATGATSLTPTLTIGANKVTNSMLAQVATSTFQGRVTAGTGNVETLTATQATSLLNTFTTALKGLVPASGGGTTNFLRADGTWAAPASTGLTSLNALTASTQTFATGSTGTDFNISSSTSTHTFNLPTASATNRGLLSSTDWSAFSGKQEAITLTTTGTSGPATLVGNTLNIPQYTTGSGGSYLFSNGLTDTAGSVTNDFFTGKGGGQILYGGNTASGVLTLSSTNNATKGTIWLGTGFLSGYYETEKRLFIGNTPNSNLLSGVLTIDGSLQSTFTNALDIYTGNVTSSNFAGVSVRHGGSASGMIIAGGFGGFSSSWQPQLVIRNVNPSFGTVWPTELRLQLFGTDGNSYITGIGTNTFASDLIIRTSSVSSINTGSVRLAANAVYKLAVTTSGVAVGTSTGALHTPTAYLHLAAGTTTLNTAPLKFTTGALNTTAETGALEYDGTNLYFTRAGTTRESIFTGNNAATAPTSVSASAFARVYGVAPGATGQSANNPILSTPNSWASVVINGTPYKIPLYT